MHWLQIRLRFYPCHFSYSIIILTKIKHIDIYQEKNGGKICVLIPCLLIDRASSILKAVLFYSSKFMKQNWICFVATTFSFSGRQMRHVWRCVHANAHLILQNLGESDAFLDYICKGNHFLHFFTIVSCVWT